MDNKDQQYKTHPSKIKTASISGEHFSREMSESALLKSVTDGISAYVDQFVDGLKSQEPVVENDEQKDPVVLNLTFIRENNAGDTEHVSHATVSETQAQQLLRDSMQKFPESDYFGTVKIPGLGGDFDGTVDPGFQHTSSAILSMMHEMPAGKSDGCSANLSECFKLTNTGDGKGVICTVTEPEDMKASAIKKTGPGSAAKYGFASNLLKGLLSKANKE